MIVLFDSRRQEPILLRNAEGVGIQQDGTSMGTLVNTAIYFRIRT